MKSVPFHNIQDLQTLVSTLPRSSQELFHHIFEVRHETLDSNHSTHRIIRVRNRWLEEVTSFDETRRRRGPAPEKAKQLQRRCKGESDCFFCSEAGKNKLMARPGSGRVGKCFYFPPHSGFGQYHRLIFPDEHNPLNFAEEILQDMFACGERWALEMLEEAEADGQNPPPVFYFMAWNVLCGSVIHAHSQVTLSAEFAEGGVERLAKVSQRYFAHHHRDFFKDFIQLHETLGLTVRFGAAWAFPSLTPVKEREVWLLHNAPSPAAHLPNDLLYLLHHVLECLAASAESPSPAFNISVAFPPLHPLEEWENFPIVIRLVDRGWPLLGVTDWGTMEMYGSSIVANDPFALASLLKSHLCLQGFRMNAQKGDYCESGRS